MQVVEELDIHGRPQQRVALLHGPPGLGKTTLAHVVASHAGYNVVEINASDDRSLEAFRTKVSAATQMRSVSSRDRRPNCLVLDEIDGAPTAAINFLISAIEGGRAKRKKGDAAPPLQRPIICICNDLFVPALRKLKPISMVVSVRDIRLLVRSGIGQTLCLLILSIKSVGVFILVLGLSVFESSANPSFFQ